ncbi:putative transmembrane protein [Gregarina niphandrodes]|uniref:Transmembrane protein n=1 Tax=Gregarina niphandrodes TaxID=110365 RepID=A0A023B751_GRENI|nr:putative transmembrane protein [Gregarina niphandrodes]EZG67030.1 putative transmembrane protein [Gregarina niphandrodes]|eukprot:XP_011130357.1 putative transmembrane protein [Gregarina niphandrodes]
MSEGNDDGLVEKGRSEISSATRSTSIVCNGDLEQQDYIEATWFHKFVFLALGFADLFYWNCVLNILFDIRDKYYPAYPSMTDTLNAVNNITSLIVAIYTIKTGAMNMTVILASGALLSVACLLTAIAVQWCPGVSGVVWLHIANAVAGACSGFYQTGACGLASVVGQGGLTGYVSAGQGVTGVATFALWQIISHSKLDVKPALWTLMAIGCGITLTSAYFFWLLLRKPEIARRVAQVRKSLKEEANDPDAPSYLFIFKSSWLPMCTTFWCMFISLFVRLNTHSWRRTYHKHNKYINPCRATLNPCRATHQPVPCNTQPVPCNTQPVPCNTSTRAVQHSTRAVQHINPCRATLECLCYCSSSLILVPLIGMKETLRIIHLELSKSVI